MFNNLHNSCAQISKIKKYCSVKSSASYFHVKTKILLDFQICLKVILKLDSKCQEKSNFIVPVLSGSFKYQHNIFWV